MDSGKKAELRRLQARVDAKDSDLAALAEELLQRFGNAIWAEAKRDIEYQINGFTDSASYYQKPAIEARHSGFMPTNTVWYRERKGAIRVMKADTTAPVEHELGARQKFFVSAPIGELQELAKSHSDEVAIQMPELTKLIGAQEHGEIVMMCAKSDVQQMVDVTRSDISNIIHVILNPDTWDKMDELSRIKKERAQNAKVVE